MKYVCKRLPEHTPLSEIELKVDEAGTHGWQCVSMTLRHPDLLFLFRGDFSNLGDSEIALNLLDSFK